MVLLLHCVFEVPVMLGLLFDLKIFIESSNSFAWKGCLKVTQSNPPCN